MATDTTAPKRSVMLLQGRSLSGSIDGGTRKGQFSPEEGHMYKRRSAGSNEAEAGQKSGSRVTSRSSAVQMRGSMDIMALQRTIGNAAVVHLMTGGKSVQRVVTPGQSGAKRLEDVLPREEWYRAYLDPLDHKVAREKHPDDPGELYDHEASPGFQAGMVAAYDRYLNDPETIGDRVDFDMYQDMHDAVISNLKEKPGVSGNQDLATLYPLRANSPTPSVLGEQVGGRSLMVKADLDLVRRYAVEPDALALTWSGHLQREHPALMITETLYKDSEVKALVTEVLDRFYEKLQAADTPRDKFKAIGWVVRTIHVIHPYADANRRLNVHVLLPRLLLAAGFQPVIFKDMEELFQGGRSLEEIADALEAGQAGDLLSNHIETSGRRYAAESVDNRTPTPPPTIQIPSLGSIGEPFAPHEPFGQSVEDFDPFIEGRWAVAAPKPSTSPAHREELETYLTQSLRQAHQEAAQDPNQTAAHSNPSGVEVSSNWARRARRARRAIAVAWRRAISLLRRRT